MDRREKRLVAVTCFALAGLCILLAILLYGCERV
jgi:hypothetical protein